jgi:hypothetical protein
MIEDFDMTCSGEDAGAGGIGMRQRQSLFHSVAHVIVEQILLSITLLSIALLSIALLSIVSK